MCFRPMREGSSALESGFENGFYATESNRLNASIKRPKTSAVKIEQHLTGDRGFRQGDL